MSTIETVKKIIAEQLCISTEDIKDDANIIEDLGADSLDVVELLMTFEDEFKVSIPDDKLEELKTIPQIVKVIDEYTQK
ncbi:MAG: acyl carrier protein [Clostridia bacterium]|jgi:acyl carrier protein|nr:acyl carrier protein [Clostridia bacterium]